VILGNVGSFVSQSARVSIISMRQGRVERIGASAWMTCPEPKRAMCQVGVGW
jgi:hypothetical protein